VLYRELFLADFRRIIRLNCVARSRTRNRERPKCARCARKERVYLQLSLSVAFPVAGVSQLQLGPDAQVISPPFFLMYLYSTVVLVGNSTVTLSPGLVRNPDKSRFEHSPLQVG
jgi:hypothetical protein